MSNTGFDETRTQVDQVELITARLLRQARRTGFFDDVIRDARDFHEQDGYAWDVALALSLQFWGR